MSNANTYQHGGTHYKTAYEHWDFAVGTLENRYLEGQITKYVGRWRKKGGVLDLEKSLHFARKLREEFQAKRVLPFARAALKLPDAARYCEANEIEGRERDVIMIVATWQREHHLDRIELAISDLIDLERAALVRSDAVKAGAIAPP